MITLLSAILGLLGSAFPDLLKMLRDRADRAHEIMILKMQMEQQRLGHSQRLEEIQTTADVAEAKAIYKTYHVGIAWVDALNGTVRPVLAYAFFLLYTLAKLMALLKLPAMTSLPAFLIYETLWSAEDHAVFTGIISFYFGQRALSKFRNNRL